MMSKKARQQEEAIKQKIVSAYRHGKCDSEGVTVRRGMVAPAGKGSAFRFRPTERFRQNFDQIEWRHT